MLVLLAYQLLVLFDNDDLTLGVGAISSFLGEHLAMFLVLVVLRVKRFSKVLLRDLGLLFMNS